MSSLTRMLSVLNYFTVDKPVWTADEISETLDCSIPTAYRYLKELVSVGLLQRLNAGEYALGPRVALLDYIIRTSDPLLEASMEAMQVLADDLECTCVLSRYDGGLCLDIHHEDQSEDLKLTYGRGRPRPLLKGASPKVILANLPVRRLKQVYETHMTEIAQLGLAQDWPSFRKYMQAIKKEGVYISNGELDENISAIGMPLVLGDGEIIGALAVVMRTKRFALLDLAELQKQLKASVEKIEQRFSQIIKL